MLKERELGWLEELWELAKSRTSDFQQISWDMKIYCNQKTPFGTCRPGQGHSLF